MCVLTTSPAAPPLTSLPREERTSRGAEVEQDGCVCGSGELRKGDGEKLILDRSEAAEGARATPPFTAEVKGFFFPFIYLFFFFSSARRDEPLLGIVWEARHPSPSPGPTIHSPAFFLLDTLVQL